MKNRICKTLVATAVSLAAAATQAEVAVIVNGSVAVSSISTDVAADIFLSKMNALPDGTKMVPLDQEEGRKARDEFYSKVVKKDAAQLNAYWSRLIFTGKGEPPKKVADDAEVVALVAANPNMIGYVQASAVTPGVKVLLKMP
ncbi:MAG TPA: phosphate ABC transporter substrate-binding protein [Pseudomonadales bacterium]|nr:phosphate ABC transporter substrate-binding protein [Pseudomonadales bacterium]